MSNGQIPEEVIEAVLKHHDIVDVIGKYVHLTKQGRNMKGLCPFHSEKSPSFNVHPEKQIFKCFGCGAGGNAITFLRDIEGFSFGEAVRHLAAEAGMTIGWQELTQEQTEKQQERDHLLKAHEFAAMLYHHILINFEEGKPAIQYLKQRGFTDSLIETFQIGYAPARWDTLATLLQKREYKMPLMESGGLLSARSSGDGYVDKFRDRIIFPIRDAKGKVIAFAGRTMGNEQPKYLNSPETILFRKSRVLYNLHQARTAIKKEGAVVIFEGYADVIRAWSAGVHHGVGTMGTSLTEEHARALRLAAEEVVLCYDGDDAGQSAAYKSLSLLEKAGLTVKVAVVPDKLDPDEYIAGHGADAFRLEIVGAALPAVKFRLHHLRRNFNFLEPDAKLRYVRTAIREVIADLSSPTEREHYLKELSAEYQVSLDAIKQETNQIRQELQKKRQNGDNNDNSWNNVRNDGGEGVPLPKPIDKSEKAETDLLTAMMHDKEVADYVQQHLGDAFNREAHAALAAYLYAYYAQGFAPDASRFMSSLQDERLERVASSMLMPDLIKGINAQVIDDCIRVIQTVPKLRAIEQMEQERIRVERAGDPLRAARMEQEIITLKNQLKGV
ncbi:DNA primase [Paenibacillus koleovorans]|uniref:DNA primase n=1 Tax=Paenibacillus koleovorans TaxID=121608 RepID=UPI000FD90952|nr:DNA primase [Paenibacillus koleovorans]